MFEGKLRFLATRRDRPTSIFNKKLATEALKIIDYPLITAKFNT